MQKISPTTTVHPVPLARFHPEYFDGVVAAVVSPGHFFTHGCLPPPLCNRARVNPAAAVTKGPGAAGKEQPFVGPTGREDRGLGSRSGPEKSENKTQKRK